MSTLHDFLQSPEYTGLLQDLADWRRKEAMRAIVELRRKHSDFMTKPVVTVQVPVCDACWSREQHMLELPHRPPDCTPDGWQVDLLLHGVTQAEISLIEERLDDRSADLSCHAPNCGRSLNYADDGFYVETVPFEEYFRDLMASEAEAKARYARPWMKRLIYDVYDGHCFGCKVAVTWDERSTDHIQPFSEGGRSEPMNLQLLCRDCDGRVKANKVPDEEQFTLHFPLVPVSDGFEGVVW